jgi:L-lactate dehydrogenase (cytochrome)
MLRTLRSVLRFRRFELDANRRLLARTADVWDLREAARKRLPRGCFDYIDGGAEDELTLERNVEAFRRFEFRPRVLRGVGEVDCSATLLGRPLAMPLVLAPTGFTRIADPQGELAVVRAAARARVPYALSTVATRSIEEVAAAAPDADRWLQLYVWRDRGLVQALIDRAEAAGYSTLCLTVDVPVLGRRERDHRRGFTLPPKIGLDTVLDGILHPRWTWAFARSEPIVFANVVGSSVGHGAEAVSLADQSLAFDPDLSWDDVAWCRERWRGSFVVKGVQTVEDAVLAADAGADAIAVSNHGGRQLDGAPPALELIPDVAAAVGGRTQVICDGGIRRGADIVKAIALGADAAMAGRAYLYALGAAGEAGVDWLLELFRADVERTLALLGCRTLAELGPEHVRQREDVMR